MATQNWQQNFSKMRDSLIYLLDNDLYTDCSILVGSCRQELTAHKLILIQASPVFERKLKNCHQIGEPFSDPAIFQIFLRSLYLEEVSQFSVSETIQLYYLAEKFQIAWMKEKCLDFITQPKHRNLYEVNCFLSDIGVEETAGLFETQLKVDEREHPSADKQLVLVSTDVVPKRSLDSKEMMLKQVDRFSSSVNYELPLDSEKVMSKRAVRFSTEVSPKRSFDSKEMMFKQVDRFSSGVNYKLSLDSEEMLFKQVDRFSSGVNYKLPLDSEEMMSKQVVRFPTEVSPKHSLDSEEMMSKQGGGFSPDVNHELPMDSEKMMFKASKTDDVEFLKKMKMSGASLTITDSFGWSLLHYAADGGSINTVKWLLSNPASVEVNSQTTKGNGYRPEGSTPLHLAAWNGNLEMVDLLMSYGADPHVKDAKGKTSIKRSSGRGYSDCSARMKDI